MLISNFKMGMKVKRVITKYLEYIYVCVNHGFYADDACLIVPCAIDLQQLLNIYHRYIII